jgi:PadR family transcriptional regulator PadR
MDRMIRSFFLGFVKINILHHAAKEPVYGLWFIEELARHGYDMSPGTLYPIFHSLEGAGYLGSEGKNVNGKVRKYYRTTPRGKRALQVATRRARELLNEILDDEDPHL